MIDLGAHVFSNQHFAHPHNVSFHIFRLKAPEHTMDQSAPSREGVLITSASLKILVASTPAFEYYWEDRNDDRALQYAHLDFDLLDMQELSSFTGLLPEVWGLVPAADQPKLSTL